jgi:uncharacterized protein YjdB
MPSRGECLGQQSYHTLSPEGKIEIKICFLMLVIILLVFQACTDISPSATIAVDSVALDKATLSMTVGGASVTLGATVSPSDATNQKVAWSSSDTAIVTVGSSGTVSAVAAGSATITVKTEDGGKTATCAVKVSSVGTMSISPSKLTLINGQTSSILTASISPTPGTAPILIWSSDTPSVAKVDASGLVTTVANGSATITAKTSDGAISASCPVEVISTTNDSIAGQVYSGTSTSSGYTFQYTYSFDSSNGYTLLKDTTHSSTTSYGESRGTYDILNNYITLTQTETRIPIGPSDTTTLWTTKSFVTTIPVLLEGNILCLPTDQTGFFLFGHGTSGIVGTWDAAYYISDHYGERWYQKFSYTGDKTGNFMMDRYSSSSGIYDAAPTDSYAAQYAINTDNTISVSLSGSPIGKLRILDSCLAAVENSGGGVVLFTKQ